MSRSLRNQSGGTDSRRLWIKRFLIWTNSLIVNKNHVFLCDNSRLVIYLAVINLYFQFYGRNIFFLESKQKRPLHNGYLHDFYVPSKLCWCTDWMNSGCRLRLEGMTRTILLEGGGEYCVGSDNDTCVRVGSSYS